MGWDLKRKKEYNREYYQKHKEELLKKQKEYKENMPEHVKEKIRRYQKEWYQENKEKIKVRIKEWRKKNRIRINAQRNEYRKKIYMMIIKKLGDKCAHCGNEDMRVLQIDHIHGGGEKERREIGPRGIYHKIIKMPIEEAKKEYQILCANCNVIKKYKRKEFREKVVR